MASVSVVIPTWNALPRLRRCLQCLASQTRRPEEVIVVDNASRDDTAKTMRGEYPWVAVVRLPRNLGTSGGVNAGVKAASGDFIVTLDSDAYPTPTWLEALQSALEEAPVFSFAACRLLLASDPRRIDSAGDAFDPLIGGIMRGHGEPDGPAFDNPCEVFTATGAASIYRRGVFEHVGLLDESLFIYSDDIDFGFRARLLGYRCVYVPDAIVHHDRSATFGRGSSAQMRLVYRNRVTVYLKNMPWGLIKPRLGGIVHTWAAALRHAPHRGAAFRGYCEAFLRMGATLRARRGIQRTRCVDLACLLEAMTPDGVPMGKP